MTGLTGNENALTHGTRVYDPTVMRRSPKRQLKLGTNGWKFIGWLCVCWISTFILILIAIMLEKWAGYTFVWY